MLSSVRNAAVLAALVALHVAAPAGAQGPPLPPPIPEAPVRYDPDHPSADFHRGRRAAVMAALPGNALAVVLGGVERGGSVDDLQEFTQNPDLYYLVGTREAGSALLLAPGGVEVDGKRVREVLFVPPRDPGLEIWLGRRFGAGRAMRELGVELALPLERFDDVVGSLAVAWPGPLFTTRFPVAVPPGTPLADQMEVLAEAASAGPELDDTALEAALARLREVKEPEEMVFLQRAVDITVEAYREALGFIEPGRAEYEIEAVIEHGFRMRGSEHPGFPSIVGSGENSVLLHYDTNRRVTRDGDLVVMDVGASYRGYTADVTRTVPVNGRFSEEQRALYDIVLHAQEAAIEAVRPGASFGAPGQAASAVLARGLADLGLLESPRDLMRLSRFFPHGTSHYLGLQVHDVGAYRALKPGMVITVEPGIYIPPAEDIDPRWWNIGIRIEDDVLVTERGPEVLSAGAPKAPAEIERLMAGSR